MARRCAAAATAPPARSRSIWSRPGPRRNASCCARRPSTPRTTSVTIDAIAANPAIAKAIAERGGEYVLALKQNQPSLYGEAARYFDDPAMTGLQTIEIADKHRNQKLLMMSPG